MAWILGAVVLVWLLLFIGSRVEWARAARTAAAATGRIALPYQAGEPLFAPEERAFLDVLDQAVGPEHRVFGRVCVADVVAAKPELQDAARQGAVDRIAALRFDFVVCRASDLSVLCAVALDDASHAGGRRAAAGDELLSDVCRAAGLPLFAVTSRHAWSISDIRRQFLAAVSPQPVRDDARVEVSGEH